MSTGAFDFFNDTVFKIIYSFHMPLFMLLSGYVSYWGCNKKISSIIMKRLRGIGIPLLLWGTFAYIIHSVSTRTLAFSVRAWGHSIIGIWFLWAVLCGSILVAIIHKLPVCVFVKYLIMILGTGLLVVIPGGTLVAFVYPYFVIGYAMNEFKLFENAIYKKVIQPLCGIIWIILLMFYKKVHYIYISGLTWKIKELGLFGQITIDMYRYLIGLVGCIAVIGFMKWLYGTRFTKRNNFDVIKRFGRHTLEIYILQRIVLEGYFSKAYGYVVNRLGKNILVQNQLMFDVCFTLVCALIIGIFMLKISEIISKHSYLSVCLFGKGKWRTSL